MTAVNEDKVQRSFVTKIQYLKIDMHTAITFQWVFGKIIIASFLNQLYLCYSQKQFVLDQYCQFFFLFVICQNFYNLKTSSLLLIIPITFEVQSFISGIPSVFLFYSGICHGIKKIIYHIYRNTNNQIYQQMDIIHNETRTSQLQSFCHLTFPDTQV